MRRKKKTKEMRRKKKKRESMYIRDSSNKTWVGNYQARKKEGERKKVRK